MSKVNVLTVYNAYLNRGGEDEVFEAEADLLEKHGHVVRRFRIEADELRDPPMLKQALLAAETVWSQRYYRQFRRMVRELQPEVVHFHNSFPLLSPAVYAACKREGVAVVQTLHNYRLLCPKSTFYRDGRPCEDCLGRSIPWPGVVHSCYHDSKSQTAVIAGMLAVHRLRGTWDHDIDLYITPTEFAKQKFVQGGLDPRHIVVKPNFIDYEAPASPSRGDHMLFVGRLVEHKGVDTMLNAWRQGGVSVPLRIIGDGPMADDVGQFAQQESHVTYMGRQSHDAVLSEMLSARALLFPSMWYEGLPVTLVEAAASGLPVIASNIGPMGSEIVEEARTGLVFPPGDALCLASKVIWASQHPAEMQKLGEEARSDYQSKYTAQRNYEQLVQIYDRAIDLNLKKR